MSWRAEIRGIQEAQRANIRHVAAVQPNGGLGRAVQYGLVQAHRYVVAITHVLTGSLRASHRMQYEGGARGFVYIDPTAVNPRTGARPAAYGIVEHNRGGLHAFYARTKAEAGQDIARAAEAGIRVELR